MDDYKSMLEQKDLVIQQLQKQIEQLQHQNESFSNDTEVYLVFNKIKYNNWTL